MRVRSWLVEVLRRTAPRAGWLWLCAVLMFPHCSLDTSGLGDPGGGGQRRGRPTTGAVFCDIENKDVPRRCATDEDRAMGIRLSQAAVALVKEQSSNIGLDFSPAALSARGCSAQEGVAITFRGPFPMGTHVCLDCGVIGGPDFADVHAVCVSRCLDLNDKDAAFCNASEHAHSSTNTASCVADSCTVEGGLRPDFVDPRSAPEPVRWANQVGIAQGFPDTNTLTRSAATTGAFDAGAASAQTISRGDGYVEFTVTETDKDRVCGLSSGPIPDPNPSSRDVDFGILLTAAGRILVSENDNLILGTDGASDFGGYAPGDRLRIAATDQFDGTATVSYSLIPAACADAGCDGSVFHTSGRAAYPFRVDASLKQQGATLKDVRLVRVFTN